MNISSQIEIGELVDRIETWNPARSDSGQSFTYVDLSSINRETKQISGEQAILCSDAPSRARQLVQTNDVLVSTVRPNLNGVAMVPDYLNGATASTGFCVLRPRNSKLDASYLFHWVKSPRFIGEMTDRATGASYPAVTDRIVRESKIPLPPLSEQKRIAAILDQADALRTKRRAALAKLDELTQSIFLEMFGDPAANPKGWEIKLFGEICETQLGKMLDKKQQMGIGRRPYLRNANVQWFRFEIEDVLEMDFNEVERIKFQLRPGDLLICEGGEPGRAAVWEGQIEECYFQKALHRARPMPDTATPEYLARLLWFLSERKILSGVTSATIAHLTAVKLRELKIMLPSYCLQKKFSDRIKQIRKMKSSHEGSLIILGQLFASLQQRAFSGTL